MQVVVLLLYKGIYKITQSFAVRIYLLIDSLIYRGKKINKKK